MKEPKIFQNPIIPGFYPDPSIVRVEEDYYLVTSSFAYFPGVPIFHSKDLVNWRQIGHVLDRPSQLPLAGVTQSEGIYAPTIRYHKGIYYVITTNVSRGGNFIVTAKNPEGPWSDPYWLPDAPGIDPSLFFDEDRVYYIGTAAVPQDEKYFGDNEIYLRELDLKTMSLKGERVGLWRGALKNAIWAEAPHLYKINDYYYLMIAEGGTGHYHAITIARSEKLEGPYEGYAGNPILTHRHLGLSYPIVNTGHGDLVQTQTGDWWMVLLASRPYGGYYRNLGRETFLVPVIWEDGWPVVSPGTGRVEFSFTCPKLPEAKWEQSDTVDHFEEQDLKMCWNFIRTPQEPFFSLKERAGFLRLKLGKDRLGELGQPSFIGRRQQHLSFKAGALMDFSSLKDGQRAGIALFQNHRFHFRFEITMEAGVPFIQLVECKDGNESVLSKHSFSGKEVELMVTAFNQDYSFFYKHDDDLKPLVENVDGRILSTDIAGGFVGAYIGLFAEGDGTQPMQHVDFDWFLYSGI